MTLVDGVEVGDWASEGKLWCPGCDSTTSTIKGSWERGEGCPYCGLSSESMTEVVAAQYRHGETKLTERLTELLKRADKAETEAYRLRSRLASIKHAVGTESDSGAYRLLDPAEVTERVEGHLATAAQCLTRADPIAGMPLDVLQADLLRAQVALGWALVEALRAAVGLPGVPRGGGDSS